MNFLNLKNTVSSHHNLEQDDVLKLKSALAAVGKYETPDYGFTSNSDERMFDGVKAFQKENGLRADGEVGPDGETVDALGTALREQPRNGHPSQSAPDDPDHDPGDIPPKPDCGPVQQAELKLDCVIGNLFCSYVWECVPAMVTPIIRG